MTTTVPKPVLPMSTSAYVVRRRVGRGVNLNPNSACNWACLYCQVDNLQRGRPPIDLQQLTTELDSLLAHDSGRKW